MRRGPSSRQAPGHRGERRPATRDERRAALVSPCPGAARARVRVEPSRSADRAMLPRPNEDPRSEGRAPAQRRWLLRIVVPPTAPPRRRPAARIVQRETRSLSPLRFEVQLKQLCPRGFGVIFLQDPDGGADDLSKRPPGDPLPVCETAPRQSPRPIFGLGPSILRQCAIFPLRV